VSWHIIEIPVAAETFRMATLDRDTGDLYWHALWPAAVGLAEHLLQQPDLVRGRRVLELGCGVGLVGLAAARCGARLTLSDIDPEALALADENLAANGASGVDAVVIDWTNPPPLPRFDVILGSDLVYETWLSRPLANTVHALLARGGTALIADAIRSPFNGFLDHMRSRGFVFRQDLVDPRVLGRPHRIGLYTLWRRAPRSRRGPSGPSPSSQGP
jgi:predicted nicotinamide N-methyase